MSIVLIFFFNKNISSIIFKYLDFGDNVNDRFDRLSAFRAFGLGFGFDYGTASLTCACICSLYLGLTEKKHYLGWFLVVIYCSFVGIFVARTMFVGIAYILFCFILFPCQYKQRKIFMIVLLIFTVFTLIFFLLTMVNLEDYIKTINWAFEFFDKSSFNKQTGSLYVITHDMIWIPENDTLFFGDGLFTYNGGQYMNTDVGYMRLILYFGIVGTLATIIFISLCGQNFFLSRNKRLIFLSVSIIIFQFIFLYKIIYFFTRLFLVFIIFALYPKLNRGCNKIEI